MDYQRVYRFILSQGWLSEVVLKRAIEQYRNVFKQLTFPQMLVQYRYISREQAQILESYIQSFSTASSQGNKAITRSSPQAFPSNSLPEEEEKFIGFQGGNFEKYTIKKIIGEGAMGKVFLVVDEDLKRLSAMKICIHQSAHHLSRFVQEAQIIGQLEHPHIVPIYDAGKTSNGQIYFTMKYIEGVSFASVLEKIAKGEKEYQSKFSLKRRLAIFCKVLEGMGYAHSKGIIHRDLKPENIMIGQFGEVWIVDWGMAKILQSEFSSSEEGEERATAALAGISQTRTIAGGITGTPAYMAPEQARGQNHLLTERTDIYALGAILYENLTFKPPFLGKDIHASLLKAAEGRYLRPRLAAPHLEIPPALEAIVLKAMAIRPEDRYSDVQEFLLDIQRFLDDRPISVYTPPFREKVRRFWRHNKWVISISALILILIVAFSYILLDQARQKMRQERERRKEAERRRQEERMRRIAEQKRLFEEKQRRLAERKARQELEKRRQLEARNRLLMEKRMAAYAPYIFARDQMLRDMSFRHLKEVVIPYLRKALKIYPEFHQARLDLIKIYLYLFRKSQAMVEILYLVNTVFKNKAPLLGSAFGMFNLGGGIGSGAKKGVEIPDEYRPKNLPKVYWLTLKLLFYIGRQDFPLANREIKKILALPEGRTWEIRYLEASLLFWQGKVEEAEKLFRRLIELYPRLPFFYLQLGEILAQYKKRPKEALEVYRKLMKTDPTCHTLFRNLARMFFRIGQEKINKWRQNKKWIAEGLADLLKAFRYIIKMLNLEPSSSSGQNLQRNIISALVYLFRQDSSFVETARFIQSIWAMGRREGGRLRREVALFIWAYASEGPNKELANFCRKYYLKEAERYLRSYFQKHPEDLDNILLRKKSK